INATMLQLPAGLSSIAEYAFADCDMITKVEIPPLVTALPEGVFANCYQLQTVVFKGIVTSINERAFDNCPNIKRIVVPFGCVDAVRQLLVEDLRDKVVAE
ncbi:MAG: leucine-rich repeat domain-containing protein, partial [Bacteroidales bacterium]|nr:leucine-rich repeat domain-containing protein [Bacteroidales bacterium]